MVFFYRVGLFCYACLLQFAAFIGVTKAKSWVAGRRNIWTTLQQAFEGNQSAVIWVHCASLGEFEQGRPLIEHFKIQYPTHKILLTFFSPSGYEVRKNYELADWVFYLPLDTPSNAAKFLKITKPTLAIFVKYEYWYFYLKTLKEQQIPTFLISAIFREQQIFFKIYGGFFRRLLLCFETIFVQDLNSKKLLETIDINHIIVAGDTRLDRVLAIKNQKITLPKIEQFLGSSIAVVAGSTWAADETILAVVAPQKKDYKWIIAPHQIEEQHLEQLEQKFAFTTTLRYSKNASNLELQEAQVLIIDNIGLLSSLYAYATIAYVGGGFGAGIHNTLEAAVFEIPILFGSNYHKFKEAKDLIRYGVAFEVKSSEEVEQIFQNLKEPSFKVTVAKNAQQYISEQKGATALIAKSLDETM